jgi:hypothetical protein
MRKKFRYAIAFICICSLFKSQEILFRQNGLGLNLSANFALGTHFQRLGLNLNVFYVQQALQVNTELRSYFSFKNLGPKKIYSETVVSQGIVVGYGKLSPFLNPFYTSISNQTQLSNSIAYSYNVYLNRIKTGQVTGIVALQFKNISFITENDILAKPLLDRFRTGAVLLQYQFEDKYQAGINCSMWTGKLGGSVQSDYFPSGCYMDTTNGVFTRYSHGLLSAQFKYHVGLGQVFQTNFGIDAEQVRNVLQNRIIHDAAFLPKKLFKRYNCHIPMLDVKGDQYLYLKGQKIRRPRPYFNFFSNPSLFY